MTDDYSAIEFWARYKDLTEKDLPVILKTNIGQSTISTWKTKGVFPRADKAVKIADTLGTSVEYLVTGRDKAYPDRSSEAQEIGVVVDRLSAEGKRIVLSVVKGLETQYPLERLESMSTAG
jgi:transcriptional regulator with XRE-family HTH domain